MPGRVVVQERWRRVTTIFCRYQASCRSLIADIGHRWHHQEMAAIDQSTMSLRFFGDDLNPDEITARLGCSPSSARQKGETWITKRGAKSVARTGSWILKVADSQPGDLDSQIATLLGLLTDDLSVWADLNSRFNGNIFCGLFMRESNEGISLSAIATKELGARGLEIDFDIYDPGGEP